MSSDFIASVTQKGHPVILAASDYYYLDCGAGEWVGGDPNANSWCDPFKAWQKVCDPCHTPKHIADTVMGQSYSFVPTANLSSEEARLILGGTRSC